MSGKASKFLCILKHDDVYNDVVNISSAQRYELSWHLPEDNGEPIDFFEISFFPVSYDPASTASGWKRIGNVFRTEVPHPGNVRYSINDLYPDTFHMVEIRAHNNLGFSGVSSIVIKTAKGRQQNNNRVPPVCV